MQGDFTVLLAQDDPDARHMFHLAVNRYYAPLAIREANDGLEVIEYLEGNAKFRDRKQFPFPDLLILDLKMRQFTGLQILQWLRARPKFSRLVTVMLSGSATKEEIAEAYHLGACSYFKKPNDFNQYLRMLNTIFDYRLLNQTLHGDLHFSPQDWASSAHPLSANLP